MWEDVIFLDFFVVFVDWSVSEGRSSFKDVRFFFINFFLFLMIGLFVFLFLWLFKDVFIVLVVEILWEFDGEEFNLGNIFVNGRVGDGRSFVIFVVVVMIVYKLKFILGIMKIFWGWSFLNCCFVILILCNY